MSHHPTIFNASGREQIDLHRIPQKNDLKPVLYVLSHCWLMVAVYHEIWIIMVVFVHPFLINSPNVRQIHNNLLNQCLLSNSSTWQ